MIRPVNRTARRPPRAEGSFSSPWPHPARRTRFLVAVSCVLASALTLVAAAAPQPGGRTPLTVVVLGKGATVGSRPGGISCPGRCTASFAAGTRVTLVPRLKSGFRLVRWAGGCKGSGICVVRVSSPSAVTAVFGAAPKLKPTTIPKVKPTTRPGSKVIAEPGYYRGGVLFFVSTTQRKVQNVTTYNYVRITCVPAVSGAQPYDSNFAIPSVAIGPDGSF